MSAACSANERRRCGKYDFRHEHARVGEMGMHKDERDPHGLSPQEAGAIYVFTLPGPFYQVLNSFLRCSDRSKLLPFDPFLTLFVSALQKIPTESKELRQRSVKPALRPCSGQPIVWWSIARTCSTARALETLAYMCRDGPRRRFVAVAQCVRCISRYAALS